MTGFIIVGRGLAATVLAHQFYRNNISFKVIGDPGMSRSSLVAAGLWNPVVFKRMTPSWMAGTLVDYLLDFYRGCETLTGSRFLTLRPIFKPFTEEQERTLWLRKAAGPMSEFLDNAESPELPALKHCRVNGGYGTVKRAGSLDVAEFIWVSEGFFGQHIVTEKFEHGSLVLFDDHVEYKGLKAANIVFCEGHLVKNNPWFNWLPMRPAKGEVLRVKAPDLQLHNMVFNKDGFILDTGGGVFRVGATYEWNELSDQPSEAGRVALTQKLENMINCGYSVITHEAGVRPSTIDRRPLLGPHPEHPRLHIFNGLGTKGVMLAPYFGGNFVHFYLKKEPLNAEANVSRFYHLYERDKK